MADSVLTEIARRIRAAGIECELVYGPNRMYVFQFGETDEGVWPYHLILARFESEPHVVTDSAGDPVVTLWANTGGVDALVALCQLAVNAGCLYVAEGWWHPNAKSGQVHEHPERPNGNWSVTSHRLCEPVYTKRKTA